MPRPRRRAPPHVVLEARCTRCGLVAGWLDEDAFTQAPDAPRPLLESGLRACGVCAGALSYLPAGAAPWATGQ